MWLHSVECNQMISVRATTQTDSRSLTTRLTQLTLSCSHATRPLSHGENHIYSWWWCEKRKLTAHRQSGVSLVSASQCRETVSDSEALWSFLVVPNTKLFRWYVDTTCWMNNFPQIQTEMQVQQNITADDLISPDFIWISGIEVTSKSSSYIHLISGYLD